MKHLLRILVILLVIQLSGCSFPERKNAVRKQAIVRAVHRLPQIEIKDGKDSQFAFTNKKAGFFVGHSHTFNETGFEGWTVNERHLLTDYRLYKNGQLLRRDRLRWFRLHPYGLERLFRDGTHETFTLLDSIDVVLIDLKAKQKKAVFTLEATGLPSRQKVKVGPQLPVARVEHPGFSGKKLVFNFVPGPGKERAFVLRFVDSTAQDTLTWNDVKSFRQLAEKRRTRMRKLINRLPFYLPNRELHDALKWALISLDALVTHQRGQGIWAGLPWFNNYWGRDTFISLTGALLVTGQFAEAREIFSNFARFQLTNPRDRRLGRIPNRITNQEIIYNTADGTWWFVRALYEYFLFTGDRAFLKQMFPVVKRALQGALQKRVDRYGFLIHGDAETWMDAVGGEGPWSPRGNRAVEVQALWYTALHIGARMAKILKQDPALASQWTSAASKLRKNFNRFFWNDSALCLYDHLNVDGSPDKALRPNQMFALTVPDLDGVPPLLEKKRRWLVAQKVSTELTLPSGVLSLWFNDPDFHPYHHFLPYYPPDAAYHNGLIWTWLSGPVISGQLMFNQTTPATRVFLNETDQVLRFNALGSLAELLEPVPRKNQKNLQISGTISQAWSLAEFVRNFYQDFIGYRPLVYKNEVVFRPHVNHQLSEIRARLPYGKAYLDVHLRKTETGGCRVRIHSSLSNRKINGYIYFPQDSLPVKIFLPDSGTDFEYEFIPLDSVADSLSTAAWQLAKIDPETKFPVIYKLPFNLLRGNQVYFPVGRNGPTVVYKRDAVNDDRGPEGRYTYPLNPVFAEGIADLRSLTIYDNDSTYGFRLDFRNLIDPGWHPEFGFQMTYVALTFRLAGLNEPSTRQVQHGANFTLPRNRAFNRVIYVGGGLEVRDGRHQRLALYVPADRSHPLGFVSLKQIRFQIPKALLPGLNPATKVSVLVGLQDDHGGSGLGDFRQVQKVRSQWLGGGATKATNAPAVYDWLWIN